MSTHDDITPAALHSLLLRLQDDHQRMHPHHAHQCPLCQDTERTIGLLAELLPDEDCATCFATLGESHADTCPGKDGNCPSCAVPPGADHLPYCPSWLTSRVFQPRAACAPDIQ